VTAADASSQVAWLEKYGVGADEIALDFDHAFGMAEYLVAAGQFSPSAMSDLQEIDAVFEEMSGRDNADRWTLEALSTDAGWSRVRHLARRVLTTELGDWGLPMPEVCIIR